MEDFRDRLRAVQQQQDGLLKEYQALIEEYESSDLVHENEALKKENEENKLILRELKIQASILRQDNSELRTALTEQILDEKLGILRVSRQKLQTYFGSQNNAYLDRLTSFELETRQRIDVTFRRAKAELGQDQAQIAAMLGEVQGRLNESILLRRKRQREVEQSLTGALDSRMDVFAAEGSARKRCCAAASRTGLK